MPQTRPSTFHFSPAAATDSSMQLRFISGEGAKALLANRYSAEQDEQFVAGLRAPFGL